MDSANPNETGNGREMSEVWAKQSDFLLFKQEVSLDIQYINSTLGSFFKEFDAVQKHLISNHNMITNLSIKVERKFQNESQQLKASVTSAPVETTPVNVTDLPSQDQSTIVNKESEKQDDENPSDLENKLKIDGINNETALQEFFDGIVTEEMNGKIPLSDFAQHLNQTAEELTQYDTDGDGSLTEQELTIAMGFQQELKKRIKRNEW